MNEEQLARILHEQYCQLMGMWIMCIPSTKDASSVEAAYIEKLHETFKPKVIPWDQLSEGQKATFIVQAKGILDRLHASTTWDASNFLPSYHNIQAGVMYSENCPYMSFTGHRCNKCGSIHTLKEMPSITSLLKGPQE